MAITILLFYLFAKWGFIDPSDTKCDRGAAVQNMSHMLEFPKAHEPVIWGFNAAITYTPNGPKKIYGEITQKKKEST